MRSWTLLLAALPLLAQVETARIAGTVTDSTGAVIPEVVVTLTEVGTNTRHQTRTNALGHYLSVPLKVGEYQVTAEAGGFKRAVRSGLILQIQETAVVDFRLEVGALTESVDVTGDAPLLRTTDASQGQVIDNKKIVDLPLNGRDFLQLAVLSSGAIPILVPRLRKLAMLKLARPSRSKGSPCMPSCRFRCSSVGEMRSVRSWL